MIITSLQENVVFSIYLPVPVAWSGGFVIVQVVGRSLFCPFSGMVKSVTSISVAWQSGFVIVQVGGSSLFLPMVKSVAAKIEICVQNIFARNCCLLI